MTTDKTRSELMSRIRSKNTEPERILRAAVWALGLRYRLHARTPVGRPDLVFPGPRVAVFIDGCFWHGCPEHYVRPRSRIDFWSGKLQENVERDHRQTLQLEETGWRVLRFWEHEVFTRLDEAAAEVERVVRQGLVPADAPSWRLIEVEPLNETGTQERRTHADLRDLSRRQSVEQARHTRKWTRPKDG